MATRFRLLNSVVRTGLVFACIAAPSGVLAQSAAAPTPAPPATATPAPPATATPAPPAVVSAPTTASGPSALVPSAAPPPAVPDVVTKAPGPYGCAPIAPPGYGYFLLPASGLGFPPYAGAHPLPLARPAAGVTGAPVLDYTEGQPVPVGYHVEQRARRGLVLAGSLTAGIPFLVSFLTGLSIGLSGSRSDGEATVAMMAPIVGPFITIETSGAEGAGVLWLLLDGAAQVAGTGMLIGGLVAKEDKLVRDYQDASLTPDVRVGPGGATATWTF